MSTAYGMWQQEELQRNNRATEMRDAYRSRLLDQYQKVGDNISQALQSGQIFDPTTNAMRPLSPEEKQQLTAATGKVNEYVKNLYNPSFDPNKGMTPTDPIHTLLSKLHLMKPVAKPAAQQMTELSEIRQKYSPSAGQPEAQKFAQGQAEETQKYEAETKRMKALGMSDDDIAQALYPVKSKSHSWKLYESPDGKQKEWIDIANDGVPQGWKPSSASAGAKSRIAWSKDKSGKIFSVKMDENNHPVPGTENYDVAPPAYLASSVSTGQYHFVDDKGQVHSVTETRTRTPLSTGSGATPPSSAPSAETPKKSIGDQKKEVANIGAKAKGGAGGDRIIGFKGTKSLQDARQVYQNAIERDKIMHKNAVDAKHGDQQAMISLLMNHIGMTLGLQKGTRVTQTIINEAQASDDAMSRIVARLGVGTLLDENSVGGLFPKGVVLADNQIDQMVKLADERLQVTGESLNDWEKQSNQPLTQITKYGEQSGGDVIYAKDRNGVIHKARRGTALPQGWTLTNGPSAK